MADFIDQVIDQGIFDDLLRTSKQAKQEDLRLGEAMQRLVVNSDFKVYVDRILGARIQAWGEALLVPAGGQDGLVRSEFIKGTLCGLCLARDMPSVIIGAMTDITAQPREATNG